MNRIASSLLFLLTVPGVHAQCIFENDTCTAFLDANTLLVSDEQSLTGAGQCILVQAGGELTYDGAYAVILVEDGGTVNANGAFNLVLAKSGANVGFCGSGYANRVKHEAGVSLNCMTGNTAGVCAEIIFIDAANVAMTERASSMHFDPARMVMQVSGVEPNALLVVIDGAGRTVLSSNVRSTSVDLRDLPAGSYAASLQGDHDRRNLRFIIK